jgi:hypothetical protein
MLRDEGGADSGVPSGAEPQEKGMKSLGALVAGGNTYSDGIPF